MTLQNAEMTLSPHSKMSAILGFKHFQNNSRIDLKHEKNIGYKKCKESKLELEQKLDLKYTPNLDKITFENTVIIETSSHVAK